MTVYALRPWRRRQHPELEHKALSCGAAAATGSLDQRRSIPLALTPAGPLLSGDRAPMRATRAGTFVPTLAPKDWVVVRLFTALWVLCCAWFWIWWLQPEHRLGWAGLVMNSLLLFYFTLLPVYFLVLVNRMRRVDPQTPVPEARTAFLVTKAPSEPWSVAERTLRAMLAQHFPHPYDVWLCDERPDSGVKNWCRSHGVKLSCREGVAEYHRAEWPRRTRCKEGNVAYFYDRWGYRDYDIVVQLDCDHVPSPTYLAEMVRPFSDPAVGYVAAPSINDANAATSWSARGRLHREAAFHGPLQAGHSDGLAPSCIGSHYGVRTAALTDIGGIGPELAEDFSTSFLLTSAGWRSAFADLAEAHGEGPITFSAMVTQEFQWARSLMTLLVDTVPHHLRRFPPVLRARFLVALAYYPVLSLAMIGGLVLPAVAVVVGVPWVDVDYAEFLFRWVVMDLCLLGILDFLRNRGLLRPVTVPLLSWENWLYAFARWPYVVWGVCAALIQKLHPRKIVFRVTPKSTGGLDPLHPRLIAPYCLIAGFLSAVAIVGQGRTSVSGYVFLCLLGAVCYTIVAVAVPFLHARESARTNAVGLVTAIRETAGRALILSSLVSAVTMVAVASSSSRLLHLL